MSLLRLLLSSRSSNPVPPQHPATPVAKMCTNCEKAPHGKNFSITVLGVLCTFEQAPMCPECAAAYLNQYSTLCAGCLRPIFPETGVARSWEGADHPYIHLNEGCGCDTLAFFCGKWGEGELIDLHTLNPDKYPPGISSPLELAATTREMVVE